jgi:hypothetical protein
MANEIPSPHEEEAGRWEKKQADDAKKKKLMEEWDKKLTKEGMPSKLPPDEAAAKIRQELGVKDEKWGNRGDIRREVQKYWQFRVGSSFGEHLQAAQEIANRLGLEPDDVGEALMKEVEEEVAATQRGVSDLIDDIQRREGGNIPSRRLANMVLREARAKFGHIVESVLRDIVEKAIE